MPAGSDLHVTDFKIDGATYEDIARAVNAHLETMGIEPQEYGYSAQDKYDPDRPKTIGRYRWLVSYFVEGGSEGYYCHIGAIVDPETYSNEPRTYEDIAFCKTWDQRSAAAIATEVQRFLVNAEWN
jgi:hypothetical protein